VNKKRTKQGIYPGGVLAQDGLKIQMHIAASNTRVDRYLYGEETRLGNTDLPLQLVQAILRAQSLRANVIDSLVDGWPMPPPVSGL